MDGELTPDPALPLDGVRLLDLSRRLPAGFCCLEPVLGLDDAEIAALEREGAVAAR